MAFDYISKLRNSGLTGRGGAGYPTWKKWEAVRSAHAEKKYIVCNASEGEPGVHKDEYLLLHEPETVLQGIECALDAIPGSTAFLYVKREYRERVEPVFARLIGEKPITIVAESGGYVAGEETAVCEVIEGKRAEPRLKPPLPADEGVYGFPTLVQNVETLYYVARIMQGAYAQTRWYTVSGDVRTSGVWELPLDWSVRNVLRETGNYPSFDFFVQHGGGACGEILLPSELGVPVSGSGAIVVYDRKHADAMALMRQWVDFFHTHSCGRCVPCREGLSRLSEMLHRGELDAVAMEEILFALEKTSRCGLGRSVSVPLRSFMSKIMKAHA